MSNLRTRRSNLLSIGFPGVLRALLLMLAVVPALAMAQLDNVMVYGTVKDMSTAKKLDGVTVSVFKNGAKLVDVQTNASGKYEVNLDYGADYKIMCSKSGFVGKNISIDTRNVPDEERLGGHGMNIDFTMMAEIQGVDYSILLEPFGMAQYVKASGNFEWDMEYTARMRDAQARLLKEYDEKKKREASAEADFAKAMQQGDNAMSSSDFKKAVEHFSKALDIKPNEPVATARLSDARMRLEGQDTEKKLNEQYAALIKEADALFGKADYENAKAKYAAALDLKNEAHPKQRLQEIEGKLAELAKRAEEEKKYQDAIAAADAAYDADELDKAQAKYTEAGSIKPQEKYPKDQLAKVAARRAELAKKAEEERLAKELQEKYQAAITAADAAFNASNWDAATSKYTEASGLKPDEKYPKDQLAAIAQKKDEEAKKAEEERLAKELNDKYNAIISAADASFNSGQLDGAEAKYNEALGLKPEEKYPKDQLAAITRKRDEMAAKAEEERLAKELNEKYQAAIAAGDASFSEQDWDGATASYNEATSLKPAEKYPKDQLAAIQAKKADLAKKEEEERKARELEEKYQAAITTADAAFNNADWPKASTHYTEASGLKPAESYPKERLAEIKTRIAEEEERRKQEELNARYQAAIDEADGQFNTGELASAKQKYKEASVIKPEESYPKQRITEIDAAIAEKERLAEEEKKRQEAEQRYNDLIAKADKAFDEEKLSAALNDYKDALQMKPDEAHPKARIAAIEQKLDAAAQARAEEERLLREQQERDKRYQDLITAADKAFGAQELDKAKIDYTAALELKPGESHPTQRLADIERLKQEKEAAELAAMAAAERDAAEKARQAELDRIAAEEKARQEEEARLAAEREAEERRLREEQERLAAQRSDEERRRMEEEEMRRLQEEADRKAAYDAHIAAADRAFSGNEYDVARQKYTDALAVMPDATYPKERLAAIEKALSSASNAEAERLAAEAEQKRLEEERLAREKAEAEARRLAEEEERRRREGEQATVERYKEAILQADNAFAGNQLQEARSAYATASDIKPDETYPLTKIDQIDRMLEEQERQRLEAELAAEKSRQQRDSEKDRSNTTIDIRKEQEAEQFMRAAREREEAEKYERIKKFKSDLESSESERAEYAGQRRNEGVEERDRHLEHTAGLYQGDETRRRKNAEDLEAFRQEWERRRAERAKKADQAREHNLQENMSQLEQRAALDQQWDQKHAEQTNEMLLTIEAITEAEAARAQRGMQRNRDNREELEALATSQARMRQRGSELTQEQQRMLEEEKQLVELREAQLRNISDQTRQRNKEQLDNIPKHQPKAFADHNRSKLAMEYPPGVTEESYTEGNKVIIRRVVVNGNKADEYSKVIAKWGTFYFKNGQSISEAIWSRETEG